MYQVAKLGETVYLWFGANNTSGSGADGATPTADVRLGGALSDAAPLLSPTPTLLSHANYPAGCHEVAVAATTANGFAVGSMYAVFCSLAVDGQNPTGFIGGFYVSNLARATIAEPTTGTTPTGGLTFELMLDMLELIVQRTFGTDRRFTSEILLKKFINAAYQQIDRELRYTRGVVDVSTVASAASYVVPGSVREFEEIEYIEADGTVRALDPMTLSDYTRYRRTEGTDAGQSRLWLHHGGSVFLYPTPDTSSETVRIYAVLEPDDMVNDTDKPTFMAHLHQLVVDRALSYVMRHFGKLNEAMALEADVRAALDRERLEPAALRRGPEQIESTGF